MTGVQTTTASTAKTKPIPTKRNGLYYLQIGNSQKKFISVTEIGKTIDKPGLNYWKMQQATRIALDDPSLNEQEVMGKVGEISRKAASRGRTIHSLTEAADVEGSLITTETIWPEIRNYLKAFNKFKTDTNIKLLYNEQIVYNSKEGYAGQLDRIYDIDGKVVLADIKTGKEFYRDHALQTSAYKNCTHLYHKNKSIEVMPQIDQMLIVLLMEDGTYGVKEMPDVYPTFLSLLNVWRFANPDKAEEVYNGR